MASPLSHRDVDHRRYRWLLGTPLEADMTTARKIEKIGLIVDIEQTCDCVKKSGITSR